MSQEVITLVERNGTSVAVSYLLSRSKSLIENDTVAYSTRIKMLKTLNYESEHLAKRLLNQ
ncbi:hypothetical protein [Coleofasciculus sp. E2-BRE-01]|uniref:hypothetical protein n=1 Tax=Coleofasciculus sp. E2-BRE-01 TaxID=3069524 RepID=UPI0040637A9C